MSAPRLVLVEGASDRIALTTLALRLGRDLDAEGVDVVEMGGATNIRRYLREALARRPGLGVTGLYDVAEERYVRRALTDVGLGPVTDRGRVEQLGFFACEADLEDELIRAVGERRMLEVIDDNGDLASFRRLQHQPVQRTWSQHRQLHLFLSARSGNKARYAAALVHAMPLDAVPRPLAELMTRM
ncbi:hypothetical protein GCM10022215_35960 [Nocardioides fonticola]|uniref:OLD protein-like TOPRIM domain-containing protein n=1 Tax=Nocardioides fonticola TaxID=450363 RepID=A0ABP7XUV4_9ACTN